MGMIFWPLTVELPKDLAKEARTHSLLPSRCFLKHKHNTQTQIHTLQLHSLKHTHTHTKCIINFFLSNYK